MDASRLDRQNPSSSDGVEVTIDRAQYGEGFLVEEHPINLMLSWSWSSPFTT